MIRHILILSFTVLAMDLCGQSLWQSSHFMLNHQAVNPAVMSVSNDLEVYAAYRNQWSGLTANQLDHALISAKYPLQKMSSHVGLSIVNDRIGLQRSTFILLQYAYGLSLGRGILGFGLNAGLVQAGFKGSDLRAREGQYEGGQNEHNDALLPNTDVTGLAPDVGIGIHYTLDGLRAGLSMTNILSARASYDLPSGSAGLKFSRSLNLNLAYTIDLGKNWQMIPALSMRTDLLKTQNDLFLRMVMRRGFEFGAGYRGYNKTSNDAVILLVGAKLPGNLGLYYTYDASISRLNDFNNGSHELSLRYLKPIFSVKDKKRGKIIYNPRHL